MSKATRIRPAATKPKAQIPLTDQNVVFNTGVPLPKNQIFASGYDGLKSITSDGTNAASIAFPANPGSAIIPHDWSPDGRFLLATVNNGYQTLSTLWILDMLNRTPYRALRTTTDNIFDVAWSADGQSILFTQTALDDFPIVYNLYAIRPDGTNLKSLLTDSHYRSASLSPNNQQIVIGDLFGINNGCQAAIYGLSRDQSGMFQLGSPSASFFSRDACAVNALHWSPEGSKLAFTMYDGSLYPDKYKIRVYDLTTQSFLTTPNTPIFDNAWVTGWRPDGNAILTRSYTTSSYGSLTLLELEGMVTKPIVVTSNSSSGYHYAIWRRPYNTFGVYRPGNRTFYLRYSLTTGGPDLTIPFPFGAANATDNYPVVGDWTGDGVDKIGIYDTSNGLFALSDSNTPGIAAANHVFAFGGLGDRPLVGRWSASATHDGIGVYRSSNGIIYLRDDLSTGFSDYFAIMGNPGDQGLAGDWNGDGVDGVGVFRPSEATFYLANQASNGITFSDYTWTFDSTAGSDVPVVGDWFSLLQSYGGGYKDAASVPPGQVLTGPNQFGLRDSVVANSPGIYRAAFGDLSQLDRPVVGHFPTAVAYQGAPTPTLAPTNTAITPTNSACVATTQRALKLRSQPITQKNNILLSIPSGTNVTPTEKIEIKDGEGGDGISSNDPEIWIKATINSSIGWIYVRNSAIPNDVATTISTSCLNGLRTYQGIFPAYWPAKAKIVSIGSARSVLEYMYRNESPALILARLAIGEDGQALPLADYYSQIDYLSWTVRMRAFMGWLNYNPSTRQVAGLPDYFPAIPSGGGGYTTSILDDMIYGYNNYQPFVGSVATPLNNVNPCLFSNNLKAAFCPSNVFAQDDLYEAYIRAQNAINASWTSYPSQTRGQESWAAHIAPNGTPSPYPAMPVRTNVDPRFPALNPVAPNGLFGNAFFDKKLLDNYYVLQYLNRGLNPIPIQVSLYPVTFLEIIPPFTPTATP